MPVTRSGRRKLEQAHTGHTDEQKSLGETEPPSHYQRAAGVRTGHMNERVGLAELPPPPPNHLYTARMGHTD